MKLHKTFVSVQFRDRECTKLRLTQSFLRYFNEIYVVIVEISYTETQTSDHFKYLDQLLTSVFEKPPILTQKSLVKPL